VPQPDPIVMLEEALEATAAALLAHDPVAAAEASARAAQACRALAAAPVRPPDRRLLQALELQRRCEAAAAVEQQRLVGAIDVSARSRRAAAAYGGEHG